MRFTVPVMHASFCRVGKAGEGAVALKFRAVSKCPDLAVLKQEHLVHFREPMRTVRGEEHELSLHQGEHALLQLPFGLDIQVRRRFVEHQDAARAVERRSCQGNALRLPTA